MRTSYLSLYKHGLRAPLMAAAIRGAFRKAPIEARLAWMPLFTGMTEEKTYIVSVACVAQVTGITPHLPSKKRGR